MVAIAGTDLLQQEAIYALKKELIPYSRIITPNIPEAEILLNQTIDSHS
ncbi:MAG: bifunctional hydroxymethylpyrimidine kinase/phosphomethylpyrimidine kinase [Bacteroides graminisolvens]